LTFVDLLRIIKGQEATTRCDHSRNSIMEEDASQETNESLNKQMRTLPGKPET